jgi:hypothetical protein
VEAAVQPLCVLADSQPYHVLRSGSPGIRLPVLNLIIGPPDEEFCFNREDPLLNVPHFQMRIAEKMQTTGFYAAIVLLFVMPCTGYANSEAIQLQVRTLEACDSIESDTLFEIIKSDICSNDALLQDAGCILLQKMLERQQQGDRKAETIFSRLSRDTKAVFGAVDIIDSKLSGWYTGGTPPAEDDDLRMYAPLFHILGRSDNKTALGILVRSLLYLNSRTDVFRGIPISGKVIAVSLKRLKVIEQKLCCVYPGRDIVIAVLENDTRIGMLNMFMDILSSTTPPDANRKEEMSTFIGECMEYGDRNNGHEIRIRAAKLAGILAEKGAIRLLDKVEYLSVNDPYYLHRYSDSTGFSMTELYYPVREICTQILRRSRHH